MKNVEEQVPTPGSPEAITELQKEIKDFFSTLGPVDGIQETMWWTLYYSQSNEENNLGRQQDAEGMFLYHMTLQLFKKMHALVIEPKNPIQ